MTHKTAVANPGKKREEHFSLLFWTVGKYVTSVTVSYNCSKDQDAILKSLSELGAANAELVWAIIMSHLYALISLDRN